VRSLDWQLDEFQVAAGEMHQLELPADGAHRLWRAVPPRPALILGSTQPAELIDHDQAERDGIEVARRRSGGGIVFVDPASDYWVDVIVPRQSPLWHDDVGRAFHWLGQLWTDILSRIIDTTDSSAIVCHTDPTPHRPAQPLWCFGAVGHGEVTIDGHKVVGLSQRRTRHGARLQCLVLGRWPAQELGRYLRPPTTSTAARFSGWDPTAIHAGPPAGVTLPSPDTLHRVFCQASGL
jgi:lipoate-protein ligase A